VDKDLYSHWLAEVRINDTQVTVVCSCGWQSASFANQADAAVPYDSHVEAAK
jgi:hypothetical protein